MRSRAGIAGLLFLAMFLPLIFPGCIYVTRNRKDVLIRGIDYPQTLRIARDELDRNKWGSVLTVWAIRDQEIPLQAAREISALYLTRVDSLKKSFNVWHFTWAIANIYRQGDDSVRTMLAAAYSDAQTRARSLGGTANKHVNGDRLYLGDFHILGRRYKMTHVVVPGVAGYVQSYEEYAKKRR